MDSGGLSSGVALLGGSSVLRSEACPWKVTSMSGYTASLQLGECAQLVAGRFS